MRSLCSMIVKISVRRQEERETEGREQSFRNVKGQLWRGTPICTPLYNSSKLYRSLYRSRIASAVIHPSTGVMFTVLEKDWRAAGATRGWNHNYIGQLIYIDDNGTHSSGIQCAWSFIVPLKAPVSLVHLLTQRPLSHVPAASSTASASFTRNSG